MFDIRIVLTLVTPDMDFVFDTKRLESGREQIEVRARRMYMQKSVKWYFIERKRKWEFTYFATIGLLRSPVTRRTLWMYSGGTRMLKVLERRVIRTRSSFSPVILLGTPFPEKTKDLKGEKLFCEVYFSMFFSPYTIIALNGQELGVSVLMMAGDSRLEVGVGLTEGLDLLGKKVDLGGDLGHGGGDGWMLGWYNLLLWVYFYYKLLHVLFYLSGFVWFGRPRMDDSPERMEGNGRRSNMF